MNTNQSMLESFIYFVNERENTRINKEAGLPRHKWTSDSVLRTYHFCNVRREDDRGTKEIRKVVHDVGWAVCDLPTVYTMARMLNSARSLQIYAYQGMDGLHHHRNNGGTVFHVAYVVSTCGKSMDKLDYVERVVGTVNKMTIPDSTCAAAFKRLREVDGLGSFLAGQIVADLKNDRYLTDAPDFDTFSVMGPGSKKGLDLIFGPGTTERTYRERITVLDGLVSGKIPRVHRQDLQNCLCEFSKYIRYRDNLPGRRRTY